MKECLLLFSLFRKYQRAVSAVVLSVFLFILLIPDAGYAQMLAGLPQPGRMLGRSDVFVPAMLRAVKVDETQPLVCDFIIDSGDSKLKKKDVAQEAKRLARYFLAALTVPENDLWVNLSPYEGDRIIPESFGQTEMGADLLAQDYILKQLSSSMISPDEELGKKFWEYVYARAQKELGSTDVPVSTFNKVWIVPDTAVVYEEKGAAIVGDAHLKVMLAQDYLAMKRNSAQESVRSDTDQAGKIFIEAFRKIVLPEIEKEVNSGKNFVVLRQIYQALVLATWYRESFKEGLLSQVYVDRNKIGGVDIADKNTKKKIYQRYLDAYRQGVFNFIREDVDPQTKELIPRKYFSGGASLSATRQNLKRFSASDAPGNMVSRGDLSQVTIALSRQTDEAQTSIEQRVSQMAGFSIMQFLGFSGLERMVVGTGDSGDSLMDRLKTEDVSGTDLETLYTSLSGQPLQEVSSTQSEAEGFKVYLRRTGEGFDSVHSSRVNINDGFYLEIKAEHTQILMDNTEPGLREQVKFGTVLNALVSQTDADKDDFIKFLGEDVAKYYEALRNMRISYGQESGRANGDSFVFAGSPSDLLSFKEVLSRQLVSVGLTESPDEVVSQLKLAIDRFIDLNDFLMEIILKNLESGVWSYDIAVRLMFLEQMRVGVVSKKVVQELSSPDNMVTRAFDRGGRRVNFSGLYNPARAQRTATGSPLPGETLISKSFRNRVFPLQRGVSFKSGDIEFIIVVNPFPLGRYSINVILNEQSLSAGSPLLAGASTSGIPPQSSSRPSLSAMLHLLGKFRTGLGSDGFRIVFNSRFAGFSFDHLHFQGFSFPAWVEEIFMSGQLELLGKKNNVKYLIQKPGSEFSLSSVVLLQGEDADVVAEEVQRIIRLANPGTELDLITEQSLFTYNLFLNVVNGEFQVALFLRNIVPPVLPDGGPLSDARRYMEPATVFHFLGSGARPAYLELIFGWVFGNVALRDTFNRFVGSDDLMRAALSELDQKLSYKKFSNVVSQLQQNMDSAARTSDNSRAKDLGGIDFDPKGLHLKVERVGAGIKVHVDPDEMLRIRTDGVNGFSPEVLHVESVASLMIFFGK